MTALLVMAAALLLATVWLFGPVVIDTVRDRALPPFVRAVALGFLVGAVLVGIGLVRGAVA
jgi:hypothetical protein